MMSTKNQSFPYENHSKCYKKLASISWLVLSTLNNFFLIHTLFCSAGKYEVVVIALISLNLLSFFFSNLFLIMHATPGILILIKN